VKTPIIFLYFILFISSLAFADDAKVYTDADLDQFNSDEEAQQYNQEIMKKIHDEEAKAEAKEKELQRERDNEASRAASNARHAASLKAQSKTMERLHKTVMDLARPPAAPP
jgi:uncharacterized protein YdaU (DUF1376 family)